MNSPLTTGLSQALQARLVLLANHVLSSEPAAMQKLQVHAGKCMTLHLVTARIAPVDRWLPNPNPMHLRITPAGMLEWLPAHAPASPTLATADPALQVTLTLPAPLEAWHMLRERQRPDIRIEGDARLAEAVSWLVQHLRWDIEHDLAQWLGMPLTAGLQAARQRVSQVVSRWQPRRSAERPPH